MNTPITCASLIENGGFFCPDCGRFHEIELKNVITRRGALNSLPGELAKFGVTRPFLLADPNTWQAAGNRAAEILTEAGIPFSFHIFGEGKPAPDEHTVGEAILHFDPASDGIVGIGGGVINDTAKILANTARLPYIYAATAPSMDGYASPTSSMERAGLKVSVNSLSPISILLDTDVLAAAPRWMILSGYGDMAAKYVSLCEWRIAHILLGEYYCPQVAQMMRDSLDAVSAHIEGALNGDPEAAGVLAEGLVLAGLAMRCAGVSRPASGMEHYVSHIRDMRALAFGTPAELHGIQCGAAAVDVIRAYEHLRTITPDGEKARAFASNFSWDDHAAYLRHNVGPGAEAMIAGEAKEHKYDSAAHEKRLSVILSHWEELVAEMNALPDSGELSAFMHKIGFPASLAEIGVSAEEQQMLFACAADIRDKYVLGRLLWDLGER